MPEPLPPNVEAAPKPVPNGGPVSEESRIILKPQTVWLIITTVFVFATVIAGLYFSLLTDVKLVEEKLKNTNEKLESIQNEQSKILDALKKN